MKAIKKVVALLLTLALLAGLGACGNTGDGKIYTRLYSLGEDEYAVAFRQGDRLCELVTAALGKLAADGKIAEISQKWFGRDRTTLAGDASAFDALTADEVPERIFIMGLDPYATGMSCRTAGNAYEGFDVDVAQAVCDLFGWELRFQPIDADDMEIELNSGNIDAAWGAMSPAHSEALSLSPAYMKFEHIIVVRTDADISRLKKLGDAVLGAVSAADAQALLEADKDASKLSVSIQEYDGPEACFRALDAGSVSAVLVDSITSETYMR